MFLMFCIIFDASYIFFCSNSNYIGEYAAHIRCGGPNSAQICNFVQFLIFLRPKSKTRYIQMNILQKYGTLLT